MRTLLVMLAIAPLFAAPAALAEYGPWYGHAAYYEQHRLDAIQARKARQREAVERGVARGAITPEEHSRLTQELVHIVRVERSYRSDGRLTAGERAHLSQMQDAAARHIRQATNDRDRRSEYRY